MKETGIERRLEITSSLAAFSTVLQPLVVVTQWWAVALVVGACQGVVLGYAQVNLRHFRQARMLREDFDR